MDLETKAAIIRRNHIERLDLPIAETLEPKPFRRRPRAKTAIIALAAQRAIEKREALNLASRFWKRVESGSTD